MKQRYDLIDTLRGLTGISMILYHACWIMNHFGLVITTEQLYGPAFIAWERSICMSFIIISGFSFSYGKHHIKSGIILFSLGALITAVTLIFVPDIRIVFGILTFLGSATLMMIPLDKIMKGTSGWSVAARGMALVVSVAAFIITYKINIGYLTVPFCTRIELPHSLYKGYIATYFGFMEPGFASADYFPILPWVFLYLSGYFLNKLISGTKSEQGVLRKGIPGIRAMGRHSLLIYLVHPIVLYILIYLIARRA